MKASRTTRLCVHFVCDFDVRASILWTVNAWFVSHWGWVWTTVASRLPDMLGVMNTVPQRKHTWQSLLAYSMRIKRRSNNTRHCSAYAHKFKCWVLRHRWEHVSFLLNSQARWQEVLYLRSHIDRVAWMVVVWRLSAMKPKRVKWSYHIESGKWKGTCGLCDNRKLACTWHEYNWQIWDVVVARRMLAKAGCLYSYIFKTSAWLPFDSCTAYTYLLRYAWARLSCPSYDFPNATCYWRDTPGSFSNYEYGGHTWTSSSSIRKHLPLGRARRSQDLWVCLSPPLN